MAIVIGLTSTALIVCISGGIATYHVSVKDGGDE